MHRGKCSKNQLGFCIGELEKVMGKITSVLSPSLLNKEWRARAAVTPDARPTFGHCYHSTEALWYLWGKRNGFKPRRLVFESNGLQMIHWFLQHPKTGEVVDPTMTQFDSYPPYSQAKGAIFASYPRMGNAAKEIIRRIRAL